MSTTHTTVVIPNELLVVNGRVVSRLDSGRWAVHFSRASRHYDGSVEVRVVECATVADAIEVAS
jgi:hypothetical protein